MEPPFQEPMVLLPVDEAAIRRDYAIKIESHIRKMHVDGEDFRPSAVQLAILLTVPLSVLKSHGYLAFETQPVGSLCRRLGSLPSLVKHFLQKKWTDKEHSQLSRNSAQFNQPYRKKPRSTSSANQADDEYLPDDKGRNAAQKKRCIDRDGNACVVMGTSNPEACHVIPFAWNNTRASIKKTSLIFEYSEAFFNDTWLTRHEIYLANAQEPGASDMVWNMLCLNRQLHAWWSRARLGFKCLGITPSTEDKSTLTLQFHWMPRQNMNPNKKMSLEGDNNDFDAMVNSAISFHQGGSLPEESGRLGASHITSNIPILSGHLIDIQMPPTDAALFKAMIDYQWAIICVAALSGAAGAPELLPDHPCWDDPDSRTAEWVEGQAKITASTPKPPFPEEQ